MKNSATVRVDKGQFEIALKLMCCCAHHAAEHFNFFVELIDEHGLAAFRTGNQ